MFGLFDKKVKVARFSGRKGNIAVTLTNKKSCSFKIGSTPVEQVIDRLLTEGMDESEVKSLTSMYNKYLDVFGTGNEETYTPPSVYHEDLVNAKLSEIKELLSQVGADEKAETTEEAKVISTNSSNSDYNKNASYSSDYNNLNPAKEEKLAADSSEMPDEHLRNKKLKQLYAKIENLGK